MARFAVERRLSGPCLEVGCGTGCFAECVPTTSAWTTRSARSWPRGLDGPTVFARNGRWLPLMDGSVECIFSFNTLEHVPDEDLAFSEIDRSCGARLSVLEPGVALYPIRDRVDPGSALF